MSESEQECTPHAKRMRAIDSVDALIRLVREEANKEDSPSLGVLAYVAETSTRELNKAIDELREAEKSTNADKSEKLENLRKFTRTLEAWPEMRQPANPSNKRITPSEERRLDLEIGMDSTVNLTPIKRIDRTEPQHIVAANLLHYMRGRRIIRRILVSTAPEDDKILALPQLSVSSAKEWFEVFWYILCRFTDGKPWEEKKEPHSILQASLHELVKPVENKTLNSAGDPTNQPRNSEHKLWEVMWASFVRALPEDIGKKFRGAGKKKKRSSGEKEELFSPPKIADCKKRFGIVDQIFD